MHWSQYQPPGASGGQGVCPPSHLDVPPFWGAQLQLPCLPAPCCSGSASCNILASSSLRCTEVCVRESVSVNPFIGSFSVLPLTPVVLGAPRPWVHHLPTVTASSRSVALLSPYSHCALPVHSSIASLLSLWAPCWCSQPLPLAVSWPKELSSDMRL